MPDGVMQWFDKATGEGRIMHSGRRFAVKSSAVDPAARITGARVHFDVGPRAEGDVAENVTLRAGTRVSKRQRRFGDLIGARQDDTKGYAPFSSAQHEIGRRLQMRPMEVARRWATLVEAGNLDGALLLYAPNASVRADGDVHIGRAAISRYLDSSQLTEAGLPVAVDGPDGRVHIRWNMQSPDGQSIETQLQIAHGEIMDQSVRSVTEAKPDSADALDIEVTTAGRVTIADKDHAHKRITKLVGGVDEPVHFVSIRLEFLADPSATRPALARISLDLDGEILRTHVSAQSVTEAIDLAGHRLERRIQQYVERRRDLRRRSVVHDAGEWHHGDQPTLRPPYFPRPVDMREIVRHKTFEPTSATTDEAAFDLESMDFDFLLFNDLSTGQDALVERREDQSLRVQHAHGIGDEDPLTGATVEFDRRPAPRRSVTDARQLLDVAHDPFVFFRDEHTGRGRVLYRRYDGHYGLITPADEPTEASAVDDGAPAAQSSLI